MATLSRPNSLLQPAPTCARTFGASGNTASIWMTCRTRLSRSPCRSICPCDRFLHVSSAYPWLSCFLIEDLDGFAPGGGLRGADLAQIQNVALHHPPTLEALVLHDAPIGVRLAVLLPSGLAQEHDPSLAKRISLREQGRSSLQRLSAVVVQNSRAIS